MRLRLAISLCLAFSQGSSAMMRPRVVETVFPTDDVVIASLVVEAPRDGRQDATKAIQQAIDEAAAAGGGVVFLPAGRYRLAGRLTLREGVTLRGDWKQDEVPRSTILMPTADKGNADAPPAITMERGSGIREVVLWYPDQTPDAIVPYPWTLRTSRTATGNNTTVRNVTLVNPYQGIKIGPEWNELHTIRNVCGTPLRAGIWIDTTTDIGRLIDVDFRPRWWEESGLPGAPTSAAAKAALRASLMRGGTGVEMRRSDWEYVYRVRVEGYGIGLVAKAGQRGTANAVMFGCELLDCGTALRLEALNAIGLSVTGCRLSARRHAVHAPPSFTTIAQLINSAILSRGGCAVALEGRGTLTFHGCSFEAQGGAPVVATRGALSLLGCELKGPREHIRLGKAVRRARILGNQFAGEPGIENLSRGDVQITHHRFDLARPDVSPHPSPPDPCPATEELLVVTDFGAGSKAQDNTSAFAKALEAAGKAGGGTVYVPAGNYRFAGELTIPTGVELRGCFDVPHHTVSGGSVLMPTAGRGKEGGTPFIQLEAKSGLRGLTVWYPEQDVSNPTPYPWAIRSLGPGCWLVDVTLGNAWQGADFWTHPSAGHLIRYLAGAPLRRGLFVSKSDGEGWVEDVQFNPHYAARVHGSLPTKKGDFARLVDHQRAHLEALVFGRCAREHVRGTFVYAAYDGIAFRDDGGGAHARVIEHGTDTGSRGAVLEAVGEQGVQFVNAQLVPLGRHEQGAIVVADSFKGKAGFFNTQIWGGRTSGIIGGRGDVVIQGVNTLCGPFVLKGGRVTIENAHWTRDLPCHIRVEPSVESARLIASLAPKELKVENRGGEKLYARANSLAIPPAADRFTFRTGFEEGEPQPEANAVARRGGSIKSVSKPECRVAQTDAHTGKRALRVAGNADDRAYSHVYFQLFGEAVGVAADSLLSYWMRPSNERGRCVGVDLVFADGSNLRDSRARTANGQGVHPGNPKGEAGKWSKVAIPLGRTHAGKVISAVLVAYDSRTGGGPFEAWIDDLAIESTQGASPIAAAKPGGGVFRGKVEIELSTPDGAPIRYSLDGLSPQPDSPRYEKPIVLDRPGLWELRFAAESKDGRLSPRVTAELYEIVRRRE